MKLSRAALTIATLLTSGAAFASSLPLARGDYVMAAQPCQDAPFATMVRFNGEGFGGPHSSRCKATVLARSGETYQVRTQCSALGDGTHVRPTVVTERYTVLLPMTFTRNIAKGTLTYRFYAPH